MYPTANVKLLSYLFYENLAVAIPWLCDAFGFEEPFRLDAPNGLIAHAEIKLDEAVVMLGNVGRRNAARPETVRSSVYAFVDDVAVHHAHALSRGVEVVQPPTDQPFGDRMYLALDLVKKNNNPLGMW